MNIQRNNNENSMDRINNRNNYSLYNNNNININNYQDIFRPKKLSPNLSSFHKRISENMLLNKKSIIYVKPKANKLNIKKEIINREKNKDLNILNDSNYSNSIYNQTFKPNPNNIFSNIFNNVKPINDNNVYNKQISNSFAIKNTNDESSPNKQKPKTKNHARHISDLAKEIIDNANINMNQKQIIQKENDFNSNTTDDNNNNDNEINNFENSENENRNINEIIGDEDLIEETIIKDICTYDKKLWVFIKYVISPKAKQNFLKMKIKRLKQEKDSKNIFLNKDLNSLKLMSTDSIELISTAPKLDTYKHSLFSTDKMMKEITEEKESFIQDDDFITKISNMIGILEDLSKQYILYFYYNFFNIINSIPKNHNNIDNKSININNVFQNGDENGNKTNKIKEKESLKRKLFPEENIKNDINSLNTKEEKVDKNYNSKNPEIEMKKQNKLKKILIKKSNNFMRIYLNVWKKNENNNSKDNNNNNKDIEKSKIKDKELEETKKEVNEKRKEQINNIRNNLINNTIENNKKMDKNIINNENKEEVEYEEEQEEEDDDDDKEEKKEI
jgi:hypothetical protein